MTILETITERFNLLGLHDFEKKHPGAELTVEQTQGRTGVIKADGVVVGTWTLDADDQGAAFVASDDPA